MDLKATDIPAGIDWSQLSEDQKRILDKVMIRFLPIYHDRERVTHSWYTARRLVAFYLGAQSRTSTWRVAYQLDKTKVYRVVCDVNPEDKTISWWVGTIQFQPLQEPEVRELPASVPEPMAPSKAVQNKTGKPRVARGPV